MKESGSFILGLLGVAFVVLKLTDVIDWSWWYVTMPFWIGFLFIMPILIIFLVLHLITKKRTKEILKSEELRNRKKSRFQQKMDEAINKNDKL